MLKVKILVMSDFLDANNEELLKDYFSEAELMVDNLESNILAIENDPANPRYLKVVWGRGYKIEDEK